MDLISNEIEHELDEFNTRNGPPCPNCGQPTRKSLRHWVCMRYRGCMAHHREVTKEECEQYGFPYADCETKIPVVEPFHGCENLFEFCFPGSKKIRYACEIADDPHWCSKCERVIAHNERLLNERLSGRLEIVEPHKRNHTKTSRKEKTVERILDILDTFGPMNASQLCDALKSEGIKMTTDKVANMMRSQKTIRDKTNKEKLPRKNKFIYSLKVVQ